VSIETPRFWVLGLEFRVYSGCGPGVYLGVVLSSGSEAVSYLRLIDSCITQLKAQGPARTCNESKEVLSAPVEGVGGSNVSVFRFRG